MAEKGKFITFEGGEGCGKTTQSKLLFDALNKAGIPTIYTREPGGTDGAETIRDLLVQGETGRWDKITETMLLFAARHDHVARLIKPALTRGEWVICDRFTDSTIAYQGYGEGMQIEIIKGLHKLTLGDFWPDLTFVFDIDYEVGVERAKTREADNKHKKSEDRYERMEPIFHKNVRRGFLEIAKEDKDRCELIDASGSIEEIQKKITSLTNSHFQTKL